MFTRLKPKIIANTFFCIKRKLHLSTPSYYIIKSKNGSSPVPEVTIDNFVWKNIDKWHDKTAFICAETGRTYLYSDVYNTSNSLANFLHKFPNLTQGDTVAVILPNVPEYHTILLGSLQAGLIVTTINPLFTAERSHDWFDFKNDEISAQLNNSGAKLIFTLTELHPKVQEAANSLKRDVKIVAVNHQSNATAPAGTIKFNEIIEGNHKLEFKIQRNPEDVAFIPYSSGTTGLPKGVTLTHRNIVASLHHLEVGRLALGHPTTATDQDSTPFLLPMFHIYGLTISLALSRLGSKMVSIPKFTSDIFMDVLLKHRPSFAYLVPPLIQLLVSHPKIQYDHISSLENILSGAAPLREEEIIKLNEKSKNKIRVFQGYGLTESSAMVTHQTPHLPNGLKLGGSGFAVCNTECKFIEISETGETVLGPLKAGELLIRGPQMLKEYYKNEEATRESIDSEGWFHTGDIGYYDEDEHIFITDRIKDLIKVKGYQVAPAELEAVLKTHPKIADAAVIGVHSSKFGEVPKAFIVPKEASNSIVSEIEEYMGKKAASYKQLLGGIIVVKEIPKTASGKILRTVLRQM